MGHDRDPKSDPLRWVKRLVTLAVVLVGWIFILWANRFHVTPPVVFSCIGYFALVATIYNLWRTGVAAVADDEETDDSTWGKPVGAIGELEREKKTLLKAIKEAEFDRDMGKLSKADADEMIAVYRARAIEVIKELERLGGGAAALSKREQIEREVRARLELEKPTIAPVAKKRAAKAAKGTKPNGRDDRAKANATATDANDAASGSVAATDTTAAADATADSAPANDDSVVADRSEPRSDATATNGATNVTGKAAGDATDDKREVTT